MLYTSAIKKLENIKQEVDLIADGLGLPIDEEIKQTVVSLRLLDLPTTGSCQGHIDWGEQNPWVDIDCELWNNEGIEINSENRSIFLNMLQDYKNALKIPDTDLWIEDIGVFGAFRIYASSIINMNQFASYLIERYKFGSTPIRYPEVIYVCSEDYKDIIKWTQS